MVTPGHGVTTPATHSEPEGSGCGCQPLGWFICPHWDGDFEVLFLFENLAFRTVELKTRRHCQTPCPERRWQRPCDRRAGLPSGGPGAGAGAPAGPVAAAHWDPGGTPSQRHTQVWWAPRGPPRRGPALRPRPGAGLQPPLGPAHPPDAGYS